jgi:hypothetical protein
LENLLSRLAKRSVLIVQLYGICDSVVRDGGAVAGFLLLEAGPYGGWLVAIRLLHTILWEFFAGCILALPVSALR